MTVTPGDTCDHVFVAYALSIESLPDRTMHSHLFTCEKCPTWASMSTDPGDYVSIGIDEEAKVKVRISGVTHVANTKSGNPVYRITVGDHAWLTKKDAQVNAMITPEWVGRMALLTIEDGRIKSIEPEES